MNPAHSTIGLTLLVAALVVGMEEHRETKKGRQTCERTKNWTKSWQEAQSQSNFQNSLNFSESKSSHREPSLEQPLLTQEERSQIYRTLDLAHQRLQREHDRSTFQRNKGSSSSPSSFVPNSITIPTSLIPLAATAPPFLWAQPFLVANTNPS